MQKNYFEKMSQRPEIVLFADPDSLGLSMVDCLLSNFCKVRVITSNLKEWKDKASILKDNLNFSIFPVSKNSGNGNILGYLIFVDTFLNRTKEEVNKSIEVSKKLLGKKFILFPYRLRSAGHKQRLQKTRNFFSNNIPDLEYFYIGDIFGPNINERSVVHTIFSQYLFKGSKPSDKTFVINPILARDVSKQIVKYLFSFGPPANETALLGEETSLGHLEDLLKKIKPEAQINNSYQIEKRLVFGKFEKQLFSINLTFAIKETINWLSKSVSKTRVNKQKQARDKLRIPKIDLSMNFFNLPKINLGFQRKAKAWKKSKITYLLGLLASILLFPYVLLLISAASFLTLIDFAQKGDLKPVIISMNLSQSTSLLSNKMFGDYSKIPALGGVYKETRYLATLLEKGNKIVKRFFNVYTSLGVLPSKILGNEMYSMGSITKEVFLELDAGYKDLGFFISEIESLSKNKRQFVYEYIPKDKLDSFRRYVYFGKTLIDNLEGILGVEEKRTYLVLFQNNMELRPTGGFIGSFALVSFENGRMIDINVQDVYSADGQLKGHVEPPEAIKNYLGEAGWYLRDSNWDPDFISSSKKIEWFLDKEIGQQVDGVIAIDLEVVKNLLEIMGPVQLDDFGRTIDYKNLYEITQSEAEENFFPGSRKKSNFLTALSRSIIISLTENIDKDRMLFAKSLLSSLEERHVQVFFHNPTIQKIFTELNYDGSISPPICEGNCFYDYISYVDANVGVNKANYFINRSAIVSVLFDGKKVKRILRVAIKNDANPMLGDKVRYKSYIRALGLPESEFDDIKVISYGNQSLYEPEIVEKNNYVEAGVMVEINPGEEKTVEFSWSSELGKEIDFSERGLLGVLFRKQAGTIDDKLSISVFLPNYLKVKPGNNFSLTSQGSYVYNTILTRDSFPLLYWN